MNDIALLHLLVFVSTSFGVLVLLWFGEISPKIREASRAKVLSGCALVMKAVAAFRVV
jgi:hypothetical protein